MEHRLSGSGTAGLAEVGVEAARRTDEARRKRADRIANDGARLAESFGLDAEPLPIAEEGDAAKTIVQLAHERRAAVIVVGSRGLGGVRARLKGSTSNATLRHAPCPVLIVHDDQD